MDIFTIGYEGQTIENWTKRLVEAGVTILVDIREKPISRKKGFSKTSLKNYLAENNIEYIHYGNLGSPGEIRKQLREDHDYDTFFIKYEEYLTEHEELLHEMIATLDGHRPCLMCFEKNHRYCHRYSVAKRLESKYSGKVRIVHL